MASVSDVCDSPLEVFAEGMVRRRPGQGVEVIELPLVGPMPAIKVMPWMNFGLELATFATAVLMAVVVTVPGAGERLLPTAVIDERFASHFRVESSGCAAIRMALMMLYVAVTPNVHTPSGVVVHDSPRARLVSGMEYGLAMTVMWCLALLSIPNWSVESVMLLMDAYHMAAIVLIAIWSMASIKSARVVSNTLTALPKRRGWSVLYGYAVFLLVGIAWAALLSLPVASALGMPFLLIIPLVASARAVVRMHKSAPVPTPAPHSD